MVNTREPQRIQTIVIGGGQAGLAVGYYLAQRGMPFVILDANARTGDSWRSRWDSLRLFTPARFDSLPGMPLPVPPHAFPTKNEMADYLESYVARFNLPVRHGVTVDKLTRQGSRYLVSAGGERFEADHVVVAMANYQVPRVPPFARELDPAILQLHSLAYRNPGQLRDGPVLVVGAGNSGAEIALEAARGHQTVLAGRSTGQVPFRPDSAVARFVLGRFLFRFVFHRLLTVDTPLGRRIRPKVQGHGGPLIRVKTPDFEAASVERAPRVAGVRGGRPVLEDGRVLDVTNVIWCTGFETTFPWIDLPVFAANGQPKHHRGIVAGEPGLYFVGLLFLYALSSSMVHGVARDAEQVVKTIAARVLASPRPSDARYMRRAVMPSST